MGGRNGGKNDQTDTKIKRKIIEILLDIDNRLPYLYRLFEFWV
jgi:hypothetical protein